MKKVLSSAIYGFIFTSFFSFQIFAQNHNPTASAQTAETPLIVVGQTFEKEISNGEKHFYKLNLLKNQFVKIEVLQT
ncbi:MAG TPA: hypothetical protein PKY59_00475, partial [Pyrinomonadaceae bacterium]|nr:hypothetical protein [Pyrinomonadaceae bacterium]